MLESKNLSDVTFEELLEDALAQIPLYGSEWTNFNASDPGITILENLTSFNFVQQDAINTVTDAVRLKLLALLGLTPAQVHAAQVLVEPVNRQELTLSQYRKFAAGDMIFETAREETLLPWRIRSVYCETDQKYTDVTLFFDRALDTGTAVFGCPAREGASLCCVLDGEPDFTRETYLYARVLDESKRTPFGDQSEPRFATLCWQVYTDGGWADIPFRDETHGFLVSGEIVLLPTDVVPAVFRGVPEEGYAIRCVLVSQEYDLAPRLSTLTANLLRLTQRDTGAVMLSLMGRGVVTVALGEMYPHIYVFGRQGRGEPYREYQSAPKGNVKGCYFTAQRLEDGSLRLTFDRAKFGVRPGKGKNDIILVCCTEEMAPRRLLGTVYGYAGQELDIDFMENVLPDDFCLMVESIGDGGEYTYTFLRPGEVGPNDFSYELLSVEGKVRVTQPGAGHNCRVYVAACATTAGANGNVREENHFLSVSAEEVEYTPVQLLNPAPGRDGVTAESIPELQRRFARLMRTPKTAVLPEDYESIVRQTPGLCIHKVKAITDLENNVVRIVVKPHGETQLPEMSESYIRNISAQLESRRMLTTMCRLVKPQYIPIDVAGTIYVKSHFGDARETIEEALREALDFVSTDAGFGTPVRFNEIFRVVEDLPCVLSIYDLTLTPRGRHEMVSRQGLDIIPGERCLCYPGQITLELNTRGDY